MSAQASLPRVVFVTRKWPPAVGGMETYALRLSETLAGMTDLTTIALPGRASGQPPGPLGYLAFGLKAFATLLFRHRDAEILHIADMASWPVALANRRATRVLSAHGTDVAYGLRDTWKGRLYAAHLRLGARFLGRPLVIANSERTAEAARAMGFTRTRVVPLATDFTRQQASPDLNRLLFPGRLTPRKGLSWFVREVMPRLPETITLDVAGTVWDADEARALDQPRVRHLGALDPEALARAYAGALAVVVPNVPVPTNEFEGFGLVAIEAAASGGVVLASDEGGLREAVRDGETGLTLPAGDAEAWEQKLREVIGWSSDQRRAFTDRAAAAAARIYSWDRVARDTLAAYETARQERAQ